jgi:hypothetical protein
MANLLNQITIGDIRISLLDSDPATGGGFVDEVGSLAVVTGSPGLYQKFNTGDVDWQPVSATTEEIQDAVGSLLQDSTQIAFTYDDVGNSITASIVPQSISNSEISTSAGITYGKLDLSSSIVDADVAPGAAIDYTKLSLSNSITNDDINGSAQIDYSKLDLFLSIVDNDIASGAAILENKLALDYSTSDLNTAIGLKANDADVIKKDGSVAMESDLDIGTFRLLNVGDPIASTDGANKGYVFDVEQTLLPLDGSRAMLAPLDAGTNRILNVSDPIAPTDAANAGYVSDVEQTLLPLDGSRAMLANFDAGGFKLTNLNSPTADQDAATKSYVDAVAQGLSPKASAKASTIAALPAVTAAGSGVGKTLTADANGELSLDGVSVFVDIDNDGGSANPVDSIGIRASRVLIKDQANPIDNGIYAVQDKGSVGTPFILVRSLDTDGTPASEVESVFVFVREGTANADTGWTMITDAPVVDTSALDFAQFSAAGQVIGGNGIDKTGNTLSVDHDGEGLTFSGNQLALELDGSTLEKSASGIKLSDTTVTPSSQGSATDVSTFTVDQQGRLTTAGQIAIAIPASQVTDFDEAAQDAVGSILSPTSSINFTYDDISNLITATVEPAGVDHDALAFYFANEHIDHSTVSIDAGAGLSGGGDITASRTISMPNVGTASTYGSASSVPVITTDDQGRVSAVTPTTIDISSAQVSDFEEAAQDAVASSLTDSATIDFNYIDASNQISATVIQSGIDHGSISGLGDDDHAQYSLLAGRSGGQTLNGDTASAGDLTLSSTSNGTKGKVIIGSNAIDEANSRLGVGTASPESVLDLNEESVRFNVKNSSASTVGGVNATLSSVTTSSDSVEMLKALVTGFNSANNQSVAYERTVRVRNNGGTVTLGIIQSDYTDEGPGLNPANCTFVVSGSDVQVQVTGVPVLTLSWKCVLQRVR